MFLLPSPSILDASKYPSPYNSFNYLVAPSLHLIGGVQMCDREEKPSDIVQESSLRGQDRFYYQ